MRTLAWIIGLVVVVTAVFVYKNSRFGVESPAYRVVEKDGPFEIRDYPSMTIVETPMPNPDVTEGSSFMRLFRYISGSNEAEQKIAMTTPVLTSEENGNRSMSFIVPPEVAAAGAPRPRVEGVALETLEGGRFAAYRFSGSWDRARLEEAARRLDRWMQQRDLEAQDSPIIANYDPPFTPPFLRRNEILVRLES